MPSCTRDPGDCSLTRATMFFDPLPARYGTFRLKTVGSRGYKRQGFRDPFYSPGHEIVARAAVCTPASASTKEDERTGDWEDVGSETDKNASIG